MKENIEENYYPFDYIYKKPLGELNSFELEILRLNDVIKSVIDMGDSLSNIKVHSSFVDIQKNKSLSNSVSNKITCEL